MRDRPLTARRARALVARAVGLVALSVAGPVDLALATDRYVDDQGAGISPCTTVTNPCPQISTALGGSVSGDVIHVGGTTTQYAGNLTLPNGVSLIKDSFASGAGVITTGAATINTLGNANPALTLTTGTAPRIVSGFRLRGGSTASLGTMLVNSSDNVTIAGNVFDDHSAAVLRQLRISGGGSPHIVGNTFIGTDDDAGRDAITYSTLTGGSPEIDHNSIDSFFEGIQVSGSAPPNTTTFDIHDNTITNIYDDASPGIPIGIDVNSASGKLTDNLTTEIPAQTLGLGLLISTGSVATGTRLEASRNQVYGFEGASEFGGADPKLLKNSVFANNGAALSLFGPGGVTATGVTATGSTGGFGYEILLANVSLTLGSSFVGPSGSGILVSGTSTCSSSFSVSTDAPGGCGLAPVADGMFVNPAGNDFRLAAGSPLIDAGNPAAPAAGDTDVAGNPRAIAITGCPARRDIGAYEFATGSLSCAPPDTTATDTTAPETSVSGKRKLKTRKKKARVTWTFGSSEPGTFQCGLDGRPFAPCSSPFTVKLRRGAHTLSVRASDAAGNTDPTPASFTTKIKRKRKPR